MMTTTLTMAMLRLSTEVDKSSRQALTTARRWVIKIGSAILTDNGQGLSHEFIARLASDVIALREQGRRSSLSQVVPWPQDCAFGLGHPSIRAR